ncbi:MAG: hypothetical protein ACRDU4_00375 [Mycobacterium sp.]
MPLIPGETAALLAEPTSRGDYVSAAFAAAYALGAETVQGDPAGRFTSVVALDQNRNRECVGVIVESCDPALPAGTTV